MSIWNKNWNKQQEWIIWILFDSAVKPPATVQSTVTYMLSVKPTKYSVQKKNKKSGIFQIKKKAHHHYIKDIN